MAVETLRHFTLREVLVPGDGHCFFSCIIHQLNGLLPSDPTFASYVRQLRFDVVDYLQANMYKENFIDSLHIKACEQRVSFIPYENEFLRRESAVLGYLSMILDKEWADHECIAAVVSIKNIKLVVIQRDTGHIMEFGTNERSCVYVVYYYRGSHYNSVEPDTSVSQVLLWITYCFFLT